MKRWNDLKKTKSWAIKSWSNKNNRNRHANSTTSVFQNVVSKLPEEQAIQWE